MSTNKIAVSLIPSSALRWEIRGREHRSQNQEHFLRRQLSPGPQEHSASPHTDAHNGKDLDERVLLPEEITSAFTTQHADKFILLRTVWIWAAYRGDEAFAFIFLLGGQSQVWCDDHQPASFLLAPVDLGPTLSLWSAWSLHCDRNGNTLAPAQDFVTWPTLEVALHFLISQKV